MATPRRSQQTKKRAGTFDPPTTPEIEFLICADAADAVGGKLYMLGGAFDRLWVRDFNKAVTFCVAMGVLVPWTATNMRHQVSIVLQTQDGETLDPQIGAEFTVGRPPTAEQGQSFRAIVATRAAYKLPKPGAYVLVAALPGAERKRTVFYAVPANPAHGFFDDQALG